MVEQPIISLGQWLEQMCEREGLSLRKAAVKTGLSHGTIGDIIKGVKPSGETIRKLAHAFGGNGKRCLVLEDELLILAGYRTGRSDEELSEPMARLIDRVSEFSESQLKVMSRFADFLAETEEN